MHDLIDGGIGGGLAELGRRLAAWRRAHGGRGRRIPHEMWDAALALARRGDPGSVARALLLNPGFLARRMDSDGCATTPLRRDGLNFGYIDKAECAIERAMREAVGTPIEHVVQRLRKKILSV